MLKLRQGWKAERSSLYRETERISVGGSVRLAMLNDNRVKLFPPNAHGVCDIWPNKTKAHRFLETQPGGSPWEVCDESK